jgi:predicted dehydrogenase
MTKLQIGIIGPGNHAQENLLPALNNIQGIELYAVQSRDKDRAEAIADQYHIPHAIATDDLSMLLTDKSCDGVVVSATPLIHQGMLRTAIQTGKPIFVEKPPAADLTALETIRDLLFANTKPPVMQFGFNFRFSDFYRQIEQMKSTSGSIKCMRIKSYSAKPDSAMWHYDDLLISSLYAIHIHAIEMLCYTLGSLESLTHKLVWLDKQKYVLTITASFEDGNVGVLELSNASNRFEFDVECIDSHKNLLRCDGFNHMTVMGPDYEVGDMFKPKSFIAYDIPFLRGGFDRTGYARQFEFFRDSIEAGKLDKKSIDSCIDAYKIIKGVTNG